MTSDFTAPQGKLPTLLGTSRAMGSLRQAIDTAARADSKVLILGETGAGKEVVARLVHEGSRRRSRPFTAVNCSGIPETLLESELFGSVRGSFTDAYRDRQGVAGRADGGTLFLDEVGEMSPRMQAVLLRFAETGEVQQIGGEGRHHHADVRLICATNRNLRERIETGEFRRDLYYRLNIIEIYVPALRERQQDVMPLLQHYIGHASALYRMPIPEFTAAAIDRLTRYRWPGNVRELKNVAERLVIHEFSRPILPSDLPAEMRDRNEASGNADVHRAAAAGAVASEHQDSASSERAERLWQGLMNGEDFWTIVHEPFKHHELTRDDLAVLVGRGLQFTHGSYRSLLAAFGLPAADYKRFYTFLHQQTHTPIRRYRTGGGDHIPVSHPTKH